MHIKVDFFHISHLEGAKYAKYLQVRLTGFLWGFFHRVPSLQDRRTSRKLRVTSPTVPSWIIALSRTSRMRKWKKRKHDKPVLSLQVWPLSKGIYYLFCRLKDGLDYQLHNIYKATLKTHKRLGVLLLTRRSGTGKVSKWDHTKRNKKFSSLGLRGFEKGITLLRV